MTESSDWLERLGRATDYGQLQSLFSELLADAHLSAGGREMAESIDEAIRRLEEERTRDERELREFQQQYESFKQAQSGVVGWFKRHIPFTETRRKELDHRDTVADQHAEVLADNLIIARAQMVKERLLDPSMRRLGYTDRQWHERISRHASAGQPREYAADIRQLTDELATSRTFVAQLEEDIEAFAGARFSDQDDRRRQEVDLAVAREELSELRREIREEERLRKQAIEQLGQLIVRQQLAVDEEFRTLHERIDLLQSVSEHSQRVQSAADEFAKVMQQIIDLQRESDDLPSRRDRAARRIRKLRRELDDAERRQAEAAATARERTQRYQEASREYDRANSAAQAAKQLYDAYLREQQDKAEIDSFDGFGSTSSVEREYLDLKQALDEAKVQKEAAEAPCLAAKNDAEQAQQALDDLKHELEEEGRQEDDLARKEDQLRRDLSEHRNRSRPLLNDLRRIVYQYSDELRSISWTSSLPNLDEIPEGHGRLDVNHANAFFQRFLEALSRERTALDRELNADRESWKGRLLQRCRELLGDDLAQEVYESR